MCNSVWSAVQLNDKEVVSHKVGSLTIYLKKILNEVWFAESCDETANEASISLQEELEWTRVALPETYDRFVFSPVMPDRSVVVDTDYVYRIYPGSNARVYCKIPVFVRISPESNPDMVVAEIPTAILSGTWFGVFTEGELSYALSSTVRRILEKEQFEPHLAVCPIEIQNTSDSDLKFEKICLKTERLSIYIHDDIMWTDETKITNHSKESDSVVEMKGELPMEAKGGRLLTAPRSPYRKSFANRTFRLLRDLNFTGL